LGKYWKYYYPIEKDAAINKLTGKSAGSYLIRPTKDPEKMILTYISDTNGTIKHEPHGIAELLKILTNNDGSSYPDFTDKGLTPDIALPDTNRRMQKYQLVRTEDAMKEGQPSPPVLTKHEVNSMRENQYGRLLDEQPRNVGWRSHLINPMNKISVTELTPEAQQRANLMNSSRRANIRTYAKELDQQGQ